MKKIRHMKLFGSIVFLCLNAHSAWADTRFTYTSDALAWDSSKLYGEDYVFSDDVSPVFTLSFILTGNWTALTSPATFFMPAAPKSGISNYPELLFSPFPYTLRPTAENKVTVGLNGEVTDWNFSYAFDPVVTSSTRPIDLLIDRRIKIFSANGDTTCDCDVLQDRFNVATFLTGERPYLIGPAEINYRDAAGPSNWTVAAISPVPEPSTYGMLLGGLAMMGYTTRRKLAKTERTERPA